MMDFLLENFIGILIIFGLLAFVIIFGYISFENKHRCTKCGKLYYNDSDWYRKGPYLHPQNIVNICKNCHIKDTKKN